MEKKRSLMLEFKEWKCGNTSPLHRVYVMSGHHVGRRGRCSDLTLTLCEKLHNSCFLCSKVHFCIVVMYKVWLKPCVNSAGSECVDGVSILSLVLSTDFCSSAAFILSHKPSPQLKQPFCSRWERVWHRESPAVCCMCERKPVHGVQTWFSWYCPGFKWGNSLWKNLNSHNL